MKNLFIGGPVDGQWMETNGEDYRRAAAMPDVGIMDVYRDKIMPMEPTTDATYIRVPFRAGGSLSHVYVCESLLKGYPSRDDHSEIALEALLRGYRPERERDREDEYRRPFEGMRAPDPRGLAEYGKQMRIAEVYGMDFAKVEKQILEKLFEKDSTGAQMMAYLEALALKGKPDLDEQDRLRQEQGLREGWADWDILYGEKAIKMIDDSERQALREAEKKTRPPPEKAGFDWRKAVKAPKSQRKGK